MNLRMRYEWKLRDLMSERGMYKTTDLAPLLSEYGITMSAAQIHRLVTAKPIRLSMDLLAALCGIFGCEPGALIQVSAAEKAQRPAVGDDQLGEWTSQRPRRPPAAEIRPEQR